MSKVVPSTNMQQALNVLAAPHGFVVVPTAAPAAAPKSAAKKHPEAYSERDQMVYDLISRGIGVRRDLLKELNWKEHILLDSIRRLLKASRIQRHPHEGRSPFVHYTLPGLIQAGSIATTQNGKGNTVVRRTGKNKKT